MTSGGTDLARWRSDISEVTREAVRGGARAVSVDDDVVEEAKVLGVSEVSRHCEEVLEAAAAAAEVEVAVVVGSDLGVSASSVRSIFVTLGCAPLANALGVFDELFGAASDFFACGVV